MAPPIPSQPVDQLPDIGNLHVSHGPRSDVGCGGNPKRRWRLVIGSEHDGSFG
jgi:hypothetical protein